ncbi:hypothetical protein Scep_018884 [Stephania cephalantha]|uniref:Uncharacterized protein n=1 Tax=Stephania cephalantha TaxID=152367 RepID=A0AAP0I9X0_9MAGN
MFVSGAVALASASGTKNPLFLASKHRMFCVWRRAWRYGAKLIARHEKSIVLAAEASASNLLEFAKGFSATLERSGGLCVGLRLARLSIDGARRHKGDGRDVIPFVRAFSEPYLAFFPIICALEAFDGGHGEASLPPSFLMRN